MLECKICGTETKSEIYCCRSVSFDCDCKGGPQNDSEDYFCEECLPKYELIMSIESIAQNETMHKFQKNIYIENELIELFKQNKELFK